MGNKRIYGLIGKKLSHSFSADFFNKKFAEENINAEYKLFPLPEVSDVKQLLEENPALCGLNVTVPYKELIIPYLDCLSQEVKEIGAVNVINFEFQNSLSAHNLVGYNTDVVGFQDSLFPLLSQNISKALVLGTGGASKAVCYVLKKLGIDFKLVSRTNSKGDIIYNEITPEIMAESLLIINTTPLGMFPNINECPPIPYNEITPLHICYDLIYNPEETKFLLLAKQHGAKIKNGLEMLRLQALAAWNIWNKKISLI